MKAISKKPSEKSIYIWNITGSIANALLSVVVLMLTTRSVSSGEADIFSIAWSISQLMATIGTFQIRVYQATDVRQRFNFKQYWVFRLITLFFMMIISAGYIVGRGYEGNKAKIVFIVCIYRAVDSLADVYEGWFQQKERLDLAGKALTYRIIFAVFGFGITLKFTNNMEYACWSLVASYVICFFLFDVRYNKGLELYEEIRRKTRTKWWVLELAKEGLPLFVNAFIIMSIMNTPKIVLDNSITKGIMNDGTQTIFNILFMPASVLSLAYIVFRPLITEMAILWEKKKNKEFLKILGKIIVCLMAMAVLLMAGSAVLGLPVLSLIYGLRLEKYKAELLTIILGGCFYTFAAVLDNALVVIRKQYLLIVSYVVSWIYIKFVTDIFVIKWKMLGASIAYISTMIIFFVITLLLFIISFYVEMKNGEKRNEKI